MRWAKRCVNGVEGRDSVLIWGIVYKRNNCIQLCFRGMRWTDTQYLPQVVGDRPVLSGTSTRNIVRRQSSHLWSTQQWRHSENVKTLQVKTLQEPTCVGWTAGSGRIARDSSLNIAHRKRSWHCVAKPLASRRLPGITPWKRNGPNLLRLDVWLVRRKCRIHHMHMYYSTYVLFHKRFRENSVNFKISHIRSP